VRFRVQVVVTLKEGLLDPQGKTVEGALPTLGWENVSGVRIGKDIEMVVDAADEAAVVTQVGDMAERFLSNPVIEDYRIVAVSPADLRVEEAR
jgi:phosphoribosylformylglycinamidine synthase subunit PurS